MTTRSPLSKQLWSLAALVTDLGERAALAVQDDEIECANVRDAARLLRDLLAQAQVKEPR